MRETVLDLGSTSYIAPADQLAGRDNKIHEERRKKIHAARLKRKQNVLRDEIKLNKLEYKLTSTVSTLN